MPKMPKINVFYPFLKTGRYNPFISRYFFLPDPILTPETRNLTPETLYIMANTLSDNRAPTT